MVNNDCVEETLAIGRRIAKDVLLPMKSVFVGKDEIIDLLGVCLVGGENLFLLGPPGTAKSALVMELSRRIEGRMFDYLLTQFTEPNELFGPFDIRKLREGELVTNTEGMLPEASLVFLDELLNANSAILNSLLMVLNERVFRRGLETRSLPLLMVIGASNHLPEDQTLGALFDRFLPRVPCNNVPPEQMSKVLSAGWELDLGRRQDAAAVAVEDVRRLQQMLGEVDLAAIRPPYVELIHRLRYAGIPVSDRRAVKLQRLIAASALLCGRSEVHVSDFWVLRYIWDTEEQQEILASLVQQAIERGDPGSDGTRHPRSLGDETPDPESLARDLDGIGKRLEGGDVPASERTYLTDRVGILASRVQWIDNQQQRESLQSMVDSLWARLGGHP